MCVHICVVRVCVCVHTCCACECVLYEYTFAYWCCTCVYACARVRALWGCATTGGTVPVAHWTPGITALHPLSLLTRPLKVDTVPIFRWKTRGLFALSILTHFVFTGSLWRTVNTQGSSDNMYILKPFNWYQNLLSCNRSYSIKVHFLSSPESWAHR